VKSVTRLLQLLDTEQYRSGTALGDALGISRAAVWKQIQVLEAMGVEIERTQARGYRLASNIELLDKDKILSALESDVAALVSALDIHLQLGSTNSHLMEQAQAGATGGRVVIAEHQTGGRGRHGRQWVSPLGSSLCLSVLWRYQSGPAAISGLSLAAGVVILEALQASGISGVGLKWPNDLVWQNRKLAGVLVEVAGEADGPCHIVIGIGLNMYLPDSASQAIERPAVGLDRICAAQSVSRNQITSNLLNHLLPMLDTFADSGLQPWLARWEAHNTLQGQAVTVHTFKDQVHGTVVGIDDSGALMVAHDGKIEHFNGGEVSLRGLPD